MADTTKRSASLRLTIYNIQRPTSATTFAITILDVGRNSAHSAPTPKLGDRVEVLTEIIEKEAKLPKQERLRWYEQFDGGGQYTDMFTLP